MKTKLILSALTLTAVLAACLASTVVFSRDQSLDSSNVSLSGKHLKITGSRTGTVSVFSMDSGRLRTFNMHPGHVVRGLYLLSNETVLVGAQLGQSVFWDLQTGKRTFVLSQMILGFSPDRSKFVSFAPGTLYIYNTLTKSTECSFPIPTSMGPAGHIFSPDGLHLAVLIGSGWPVNDSVFPLSISRRSTVLKTILYNVGVCKNNKQYPGHNIQVLGSFSKDSKYYQVENISMYNLNSSNLVKGSWRFNLETNELERQFNSK